MNFNNSKVAVIGASGAIGKAFINQIEAKGAFVYAFSRSKTDFKSNNILCGSLDLENESSIATAAASIESDLDFVLVTTGILHDQNMMPEKALQYLNAAQCHHLFSINTIGPALVAKHFLPKLHKHQETIFAALSARVGSISDNHLGGWYSYRASKAALNMIIKNSAIEIGRRNKQAIIVGLHPGTVDSDLSRPFQSNVSDDKLFTPEYSAGKLLDVLENMTPKQTGKCFAWDGKEILP